MNCWYIAIREIGICLSLNTEFIITDYSDFLFKLLEIQIAGILLCYNNNIASLGEM